MTFEQAKLVMAQAKVIQDDLNGTWRPPEEGTIPQTEIVLLRSITKGTRGYIEKIAHQINGTYENAWYDACAVLIRRLLETLIIEVFEHHGLADQIKDKNQVFFTLRDLIPAVVSETKKWNLSRDVRRELPELKEIGDHSAHSRYFLAHRGDIDKVAKPLRYIVQELIHIAGLK